MLRLASDFATNRAKTVLHLPNEFIRPDSGLLQPVN